MNDDQANNTNNEKPLQNQENALKHIHQSGNGINTINFSPTQNEINVFNLSARSRKIDSIFLVRESIRNKNVPYLETLPFFDRTSLWNRLKKIEKNSGDVIEIKAFKIAFRYCAFFYNGLPDPEDKSLSSPESYYSLAKHLLAHIENPLKISLGEIIKDQNMADIYTLAERGNE